MVMPDTWRKQLAQMHHAAIALMKDKAHHANDADSHVVTRHCIFCLNNRKLTVPPASNASLGPSGTCNVPGTVES